MQNKLKQILASVLILAALSLPELQKQMQNLEQEIGQHQTSIRQKQKQTQSLKRDISLIDSEINKTKLELKQTELAIQKTQLNIETKEEQIALLEQDIVHQKTLLAEHLRLINYYDQKSLLEIFLKEEKLSSVFDTIGALESIQKEIHASLQIVRENKVSLQKKQEALEEEEQEQASLSKLQQAKKQSWQRKNQTKKLILDKTKGEESEYKKMLSQAQTELRQVKNKLNLLQSKGEQTLSLDEAIKIAQYASTLTGVRAALILAILDQESDFNRFTGTCHYQTALRGSHAQSKSIFEDICKRLGLDPDKEMVSCPLKNSKGKYVGSGGAMGPAQIMPFTWQSLEGELENLLGYIPNPWMPRDAVVAMALYLKRNGALTNERRAAGAYFGKCTFYGVDYCDDVISLARAYQREVDKKNS